MVLVLGGYRRVWYCLKYVQVSSLVSVSFVLVFKNHSLVTGLGLIFLRFYRKELHIPNLLIFKVIFELYIDVAVLIISELES